MELGGTWGNTFALGQDSGDIGRYPKASPQKGSGVMSILDWFTEGTNGISAGALAISLLALTRAWSSSRTAKKNLKVVLAQEQRKSVRPQVQLMRSTHKSLPEAERYSYLVHIHNPAEVGHFIARAELAIEYRSRAGVAATVKIPTEKTSQDETAYLGDESMLEIPANVAARHAIAGWVHFKVARGLLTDYHIDRYILLLETGDGNTLSIESIIPQEL